MHKTIVIDDIERKHKNLDIEEILGLINECSEKYNSKFLLILNTDNLDDKALWQKFHEKVIDKEIVLNPLPAESFSIAVDSANEPFLTAARNAFERFEIKNIRIIKKTLDAIREILENQKDLHDLLLERHLPSLVFLCAVHYRNFGDDLTLDYVANSIFKRSDEGKREDLEAIIRKAELAGDKLSTAVIDYLKFGVLDYNDIDSFFRPLKSNMDNNLFHKDIRTFVHDLYWDPHQSEEHVENFCSTLEDKVYELDAGKIADIANDLTLHNHKDNAEKLISVWIDSAKKDCAAHKKFEHIYGNNIHPRLLECREKLPPQQENIISLKETIQNFISGSQLTEKAMNALSNTSPAEYESALRSLNKLELKDFIELHFRLGESRREAHWSSAQEKFIAACTHIHEHEPDTKLARILRRELKKREPVKPSEGSN